MKPPAMENSDDALLRSPNILPEGTNTSEARIQHCTLPMPDLPLQDLIPTYAKYRDISHSSQQFLERCIQQFSRHVGHLPVVSDLRRDQVNEWLATKMGKPHYRKSLRTGILCLWRFAAEEGITNEAPRGIVRVRLRYSPVRSWSQDEVSHLRKVSLGMRRRFRMTTIPRGAYFSTFISAAWYLGLSQCDLHRLKLDDFKNGNLTFSRRKTGQRVAVGFPADEWQAVLTYLDKSQHRDGPIWPLTCSRSVFARTFRGLARQAGLVGPWKTLRASAGTAYEIAHPGQGHIFLGNTRDVFMKNYYDPRREPESLPHAPRLLEN